jgi:hypothetical protein
MQKPILVNSSFVMSSPDGKTATELKENLDSKEVQALAVAYMNFVSGVAEGLGAEAGMSGVTPGGETNGERPPPEGSGPPPEGASDGSGLPPEGASDGSGPPPEGAPEGSGPPPEGENVPPEGSGAPGGSTRERFLRVKPRNWNILSRVRTRRLAVTYDAESAEIYDFRDSACGDEVAAVSKQAVEEDSVASDCIAVFGKYRIIAGPEDNAAEIYNTFVEATQASIEEGKLEEEVKAAAAKENVTIPFVVQGVSPIVDDSFNAFEEIAPQIQMDDEDEEIMVDDSDEGNTTEAPIVAVSNNTNAPTPNATEAETESSANRPLIRVLVTMLAAAITTFNYF